MDPDGGEDKRRDDRNEPKGATECGDFERTDPHQWNICAEPG
jgi:hypothetical protein